MNFISLKKRIQKNYLYLFILLLSLLLLSCTDIQQNHNGEKGYECYEDGSCDGSLICAENICIDLCDDTNCFSNQICKIENEKAVCSCEESLHLEENECISNKKTVECKDDAPENGKSIIKKVEITWNNKWEEIPICEWECDEFYTKKDNLCTDECYQFNCEKNSHCEVDSFKIPSCKCNEDSSKYGDECLKITKTFFESTVDAVGNSITVDKDENSYIIGTFTGYNSDTPNKKDEFITKINNNNDLIWSKILNTTDKDNVGKSISINSQNYLVTAGEISKTLQGGDIGATISLKLVTLDGEIETVKNINEQGESYYVKSILVNKETLFVTGVDDDERGHLIGFIKKYSFSDDSTDFSLTWNQYLGEVINSVAISITNNIYTWGSTNQNNDFILGKYSNDGSKIWEKRPSESNANANSVVVDKDENIYVTSYTDDMSSYAAISKYNSEGVRVWNKSIDNYYYNCTKIVNNKYLYIVGYYAIYGNNSGKYGIILKYNLDGEKLWEIKLEEKSELNSIFIKDDKLYIIGKRVINGKSDLLFLKVE